MYTRKRREVGEQTSSRVRAGRPVMCKELVWRSKHGVRRDPEFSLFNQIRPDPKGRRLDHARRVRRLRKPVALYLQTLFETMAGKYLFVCYCRRDDDNDGPLLAIYCMFECTYVRLDDVNAKATHLMGWWHRTVEQGTFSFWNAVINCLTGSGWLLIWLLFIRKRRRNGKKTMKSRF